MRGTRVKNVVRELHGEKIDIVRYNEDPKEYIAAALSPAQVGEIHLEKEQKNAIVLVDDEQLSLAIGKRGQNVRLASKLVGWDIEVMTRDELNEQLEKSVAAFSQVPHITEELAENLVSQGFFSFYDLSVIEPDQLQEMSGRTPEECDEIVAHADVESAKQEEEENRRKAEMKLQREIDARIAASAPVAPPVVVATEPEPESEPESESAITIETETETESEPPASVAAEPAAAE
jgi:N utilization substance protein A